MQKPKSRKFHMKLKKIEKKNNVIIIIIENGKNKKKIKMRNPNPFGGDGN
jgi:hypothetical protein